MKSPTKIYANRKGRLHLRANRKAKGLSDKVVAERLGMARESLSRLEKKADEFGHIKNSRLHQYADAIGIEWQKLYQMPATKPEPPSLDAMVEDQPDEFKIEAAQILELFIRQRRA